MKQSANHVPTYDAMFLPTVQALQMLGGSGTTNEIYQKVAEILSLPESVISVSHGDSSLTEVEYRLQWSRTYLKNYGLVENSGRGVWALTPKGLNTTTLDSKAIVRAVREAATAKSQPKQESKEQAETHETSEALEEDQPWHKQLHKVLLNMPPSAFERLIQRLLRESGFIRVEVTGKSGDGGIDGIGIARLSGFLSFHVLFQCKRYQGSVSPGQIRDFRGAMQGRTDKGLFITTGTFTREAMKEATRDGAPPIDLIDGEQLVSRLKELQLGVKIQMVETIEVDTDWFSKI